MKTETKGSNASVVTPILKDLIDRQKADSELRNPVVSDAPPQQPDLYQDSGGGYNANFVFPQD